MLAFSIAAMFAAQSLAADPIQPAAVPPLLVVSPPISCCVLRALTPVYLTIDEPLESDKARIGQPFKLSLRQPLEVASGFVIPAGTTGGGQVVHAAKSRAMGKAGELVLAARYLDYQGVRIPLRSLRYGKGQGKDNVDTAVIVGFAVSAVIAPFITGGEVRVPAGAEVWAKVAADATFAAPAGVSPAAAPPATTNEIPVAVPSKGVS